MATLTVLKFETPDGARQGVELLQSLQQEKLIEVQDVAFVTWPAGARKPKTRHLGHMSGWGALDGAFWGLLFGMIFFAPVIGVAVGATMGAVTGRFKNYGVSDEFIKQLREKVTEGSSAVFILSRAAVVDKVADAFKSLPKFELLASNLTLEQEARLRNEFGGEPAKHPAELVA